MAKIVKSEEEWRRVLGPERYAVLRGKGTERAFTGQYWNVHDDGTYHCGACGAALFDASTKFDSGTGWPSFWRPVSPDAVRTVEDTTLGMRRVEVVCGTCDSHLGHVFPDGPEPTGERYCMNSVSLDLKKRV